MLITLKRMRPYNRDITITLDHIPEGCDYEMVLYDEEGNQVGIGKENGNGGLSSTIPNWNSDNRGYTVKVQAKNGSIALSPIRAAAEEASHPA